MTDIPSAQCPEFRRYMEEFRTRLRQAIDENKWFLSEKVGHDVGVECATEDFLKNYFDQFAEQVRTQFCEHECALQKDCPLALFIRSLPATSKTLAKHTSALCRAETTSCR